MSEWRKNQGAMITFSKSYLLRISFQSLHTNFSGCARITKCAQYLKIALSMTFSITATHTLYSYPKETWANIWKPFQTTNADLDSPLISKMELFVTIINVFYQILIVSYKFIIDVAGALYLPKRFTYFQTSLTHWNATQRLKDFLILGKKTTNKNMVVKKTCINIKEL